MLLKVGKCLLLGCLWPLIFWMAVCVIIKHWLSFRPNQHTKLSLKHWSFLAFRKKHGKAFSNLVLECLNENKFPQRGFNFDALHTSKVSNVESNLRVSDKNPTFFAGLDLTKLMTINSFSRPWNPSTVWMVTRWRSEGPSHNRDRSTATYK